MASQKHNYTSSGKLANVGFILGIISAALFVILLLIGFGNAIEYLQQQDPRHYRNRDDFLSQRQKTWRTKMSDHPYSYGIHPALPDACAAFRFPEDSILWFP